jgi:hypothetical protein
MQIALASFAVRGPQLGQMFDVDTNEAKIIIPEDIVTPSGLSGRTGRASF